MHDDCLYVGLHGYSDLELGMSTGRQVIGHSYIHTSHSQFIPKQCKWRMPINQTVLQPYSWFPSMLQSLLGAAVSALLACKPALCAALGAKCLAKLRSMSPEHALLAVCQALREDMTLLAQPAQRFLQCCEAIASGFSVSWEMSVVHTPQLWRQVAGLEPDDTVPAFVHVWFAPRPSVKSFLAVSRCWRCCVCCVLWCGVALLHCCVTRCCSAAQVRSAAASDGQHVACSLACSM